jgi:hypothetical protein
MPSSLKQIVEAVGADSAAIMVPNVTAKHTYCYDSYNMPQVWVNVKNSFDEKVSGGNVEVYKTGVPAITNHLQKMLEGHLIESVMIVPVKQAGKTIAMLELIHDKHNKIFSEEDLQKALKLAQALNLNSVTQS